MVRVWAMTAATRTCTTRARRGDRDISPARPGVKCEALGGRENSAYVQTFMTRGRWRDDLGWCECSGCAQIFTARRRGDFPHRSRSAPFVVSFFNRPTQLTRRAMRCDAQVRDTMCRIARVLSRTCAGVAGHGTARRRAERSCRARAVLETPARVKYLRRTARPPRHHPDTGRLGVSCPRRCVT